MPQAGYVVPNEWTEQDIAEVVVEGTNEGMPWALVRHYLLTELAAPTLVNTHLKDRWEDTILPAMAAELCDQWSAECVTVSRATPGPINNKFWPMTAIPGVITTDAVPNGSALLLRFDTLVVGGRGRGRMYVPGLPEASTNAGLLLGTKQDEWDTIAGLIAANFSVASNDYVPCVFSRAAFNDLPADFTQAQYLDAVPDIAAQITAGAVVGNLGSQRDRRYKRNVFGA